MFILTHSAVKHPRHCCWWSKSLHKRRI